MASIIKCEGSRGATWRVVWRTQSGAQRSTYTHLYAVEVLAKQLDTA